MLTYELTKTKGLPLYEALYRCIREDILTGRLTPGQKLPSKRALCANLKVSKITVETAYSQLLSEGYLRSEEKVGYFVEAVERLPRKAPLSPAQPPQTSTLLDLTGSAPVHFPFSVWSRLQRQVMLDWGEQLLLPLPNQGLYDLRKAIALHLSEFRGMQVSPEEILIGAGTDFLYNLLVQLLGREKIYAVEEPGYGKIRKIYASAGAECLGIPLDSQGVNLEQLSHAQVLHLSPAHHFPTGRITSLSRRQALLQWASQAPDRWIIEDDYDSEFRFQGHPLPTMQSLDTAGRVIYLNSFSKSLAPSIRISYMVLPEGLMAEFQQRLGFYSCTVPSFEQYTLSLFLREGHFEKHINRMRKFYRTRRDQVLSIITGCPHTRQFAILEEDAGLHFLIKVNTPLSDPQLEAIFADARILVRSLSSYYHGSVPPADAGCLVINYSGLTDDHIQKLPQLLSNLHLPESL